MKVIIVGAGIAGLTLALALQRLGISTQLYEKTKVLNNIGGGILLWPHGRRYLEWLGLSHCLAPYSVSVKGCHILNDKSESIFSESYPHFYSLIGGEILPIDRHLLQQSLLSELAKDTLHLNKQCIAVDQDERQARIFFSDGTTDCADLIIGADGIHSIIRKILNPNASLEYTQHCWWGGIVANKHLASFKKDQVYMIMGVGKMCITWPTFDDNVMWYLPVKMPLSDFVRQGDGQAQLKQLCSGWGESIQQLIHATSNTKQFHLPIYVSPPQENLCNNRFALIGDAAHTMGPILGQGASQAMEDVFILVNCLTNMKESIPNILQYYASCRQGKYQILAELENQVAATMISENDQALSSFYQHIDELSLANMYQDLIPLVNERFCLLVAEKVGFNVSELTCA